MKRASAAVLAFCAIAIAMAPVWGEDNEDDWEDDDDDGSSLYSNPSGDTAPSYDLEDPTANHRAEGIRRDGENDYAGAVEAFQAAARHNPNDPSAFSDLGVSYMRAAMKGVDVEKNLKASRSAYDMCSGMSGGEHHSLEENKEALVSIEKWACESAEICVGTYAPSASGGGESLGNKAALKQFVKEEVDAALNDLTMDFEIMESSTAGQIKALKARVKALEEKLAKAAPETTDEPEEEEEAVDPKDEM